MPSDSEIRASCRSQGLRIKRNNLIAAFLSGLVLVLISLRFSSVHAAGYAAGLAVGLVYANGFEYCLHRFLLHGSCQLIPHQHMVHHQTLQSPEAARYVNFSHTPWAVVGLFGVNAVPFLILARVFHAGWVAGVFSSFSLYYMAFEEIHWRTHMGGWLPAWLRPAARHHLLHHARDQERFNVFLPVFDWLLDRPSKAELRNRAESGWRRL